MKKLIGFLGLFLSLNVWGDTKISQLPLGSAAATQTNDSFPYVNSSTTTTQRLTLWDLINLPPLVSTYAPLASPSFTGIISGNGSDITSINASNISSGTLGAARLPNPSSVSLGGVQSITAVTHDFLTSISTAGVPSQAQPTCGDLSNGAASCSTDTTVASNISSGTLPSARLPNPTATSLGGTESIAAVSHNFLTTISTSGVPAIAQPACGDLSNSAPSCSTDTTNAANISGGTLPSARLPNPTATSLGGTESIAAVSHNFLTTISTSGVPAQAQPAFTDVSGSLAGSQLPSFTGDVTNSSAALTLATVNSNVGSFGSSTAIPAFTVNGKGLVTAASTSVVVAPAGTLTGTTLASNVVTSSLTTIGTIISGLWNGTLIGVPYGGTGLATLTNHNVILGAGTSSPTFVAPGTSGNNLQSNGTTWISAAPAAATYVAPTIQKFTSGSGIYTTPTSPAPIYIKVVMIGAGGGGSGTSGNGGAGGNTTFGTTLLVANGGNGGSESTGVGGTGGTASLGSGPIGLAISGGQGSTQDQSLNSDGGSGASSYFGGAGQGGWGTAGGGGSGGNGYAAVVNSGSGGGGGGANTSSVGQAGGGAGGYIDALITSSIASTYSYAIGAAGTAGAGSGGWTGGAGGSGFIQITEYYQ